MKPGPRPPQPKAAERPPGPWSGRPGHGLAESVLTHRSEWLVHRVTALYILTPILGAGGFACLAPAVGAGMAGSPGAGPVLLAWVGTVLLSAAAATTAAAALLRRTQVARLAEGLAAAQKAAEAAAKAADEAAL